LASARRQRSRVVVGPELRVALAGDGMTDEQQLHAQDFAPKSVQCLRSCGSGASGPWPTLVTSLAAAAGRGCSATTAFASRPLPASSPSRLRSARQRRPRTLRHVWLRVLRAAAVLLVWFSASRPMRNSVAGGNALPGSAASAARR